MKTNHRNLVRFASAFLAVALLFSLAACGKEPSPADILLPKLEDAYNQHDLYAIAALYEPEQREAVEGVMDLFGVGGLAKILPFFSQLMGSAGMLDDMGTVKLTENYTTMESSIKAIINYHVNITGSSQGDMDFDSNMTAIKKNDEWFIREDGGMDYGGENEASETTESGIASSRDSFTDDMYATKRSTSMISGGWGVVNDNGDIIIDFEYSDCYEKFSDGLWCVNKGMSWGAINAQNEAIIPFEYEELGIFSEGLCPAKKDGYWGVIDKSNNTVIDFQYDTATEEFINGLLGVSINGAGGVINKNGSYIVPLSGEYGEVEKITKNNILMAYGVSYGVGGSEKSTVIFDTSGKELYRANASSDFIAHPTTGERISILDEDHFCIVGENGCKVFDSKGNELFEVDELFGFNHGEYFREMEFPFRLVGNGYYSYSTTEGGLKFNLFNLQGSLFLKEWFEWDEADEASFDETGSFFLSNGELWIRIRTNEGSSYYRYDKDRKFISKDENLYDANAWNGDWIIKRWYSSDNPLCTLINTSNGLEYSFGETVEYLERKDSNLITTYTENFPPNVIIVKDTNKIFYGLFINDELVIPCEYNNISYNSGYDIFTLQKGNVSKEIRVARNGRIIELD